MSLNFERDEKKSLENKRKHGISFEEAKTVFNNPFALTKVDTQHSTSEKCFIDLGLSARRRVLVVVYTEKNKNIRLISCRKATIKEKEEYG